MENINAFVPENAFFQEKHMPCGRTIHEDSAIVSPHDHFKIIAARGMELRENESLYDLLEPSKASRRLLHASLEDAENVTLVPTLHGTLLVFPHFFNSTGLILAVHIKKSPALIQSIMEREFEISPRLTRGDTEEADPTTKEILEEIFYYTNRILSPAPTTDQRTLLRLIANFAGCQLTLSSVPFAPLTLKSEEKERLTAFLLTVFLGMQKFFAHTDAKTHQIHTESIAARAPDASIPAMKEEAYAFSIEITQSFSAQRHLPPRARTCLEKEQTQFIERLLALPSFSHFYALGEDGNIILEANFPIEEQLGTVVSRGTFKQIIFTITPTVLYA